MTPLRVTFVDFDHLARMNIHMETYLYQLLWTSSTLIFEAPSLDSSQWILSDLLAALQKEIRVLESGFQDPHTTDLKGSTTTAFQVGVKDTRDCSAKKKGTTCVFCKGPHSTHSCETVTDQAGYQKDIG